MSDYGPFRPRLSSALVSVVGGTAAAMAQVRRISEKSETALRDRFAFCIGYGMGFEPVPSGYEIEGQGSFC